MMHVKFNLLNQLIQLPVEMVQCHSKIAYKNHPNQQHNSILPGMYLMPCGPDEYKKCWDKDKLRH